MFYYKLFMMYSVILCTKLYCYKCKWTIILKVLNNLCLENHMHVILTQIKSNQFIRQ